MNTVTPITTKSDLQAYLQVALQLEHSTIPPYIYALYSIHPGTNLDGQNILRVVAVEEMLHMTLVANLLNAVNGTPDLTVDGFVPDYPTYLPSGETDFKVGLEKFSPDAIETFLKIERPAIRPDPNEENIHLHEDVVYIGLTQLKASRTNLGRSILPAVSVKLDDKKELHLHFYSIGEFYAAIRKGIEYLCEEKVDGEKELFSGDRALQIGPEYYYSGGGNLHVIYNKETALAAIDLISEQGEGYEGGIFDKEGEYSHYYRFQQLILGKYYQIGDERDYPTGKAVDVDWNAVYPVMDTPKITKFSQSEELTIAARSFNTNYKNFLAEINEAYNGKPQNLIGAIKGMFEIKASAQQLMRNPVPGEDGQNAGPTFEIYNFS